MTFSRILDFVNTNFSDIKLSTNKGMAGQLLEAANGSAPNSDPRPDIANLGIELKVLPLRDSSGILQPKERSKIKSLNYDEILKEDWETSALKKKIQQILFFLYEQPIGCSYKEWRDFKFLGTLLYQLEKESPEIVETDWKNIKEKVAQHEAHLLSEGDGKVLGASTSGTGNQVIYAENHAAKQRSYSLKHSFLKYYYLKTVKKVRFHSLFPDEKAAPEELITKKLNIALEGRKLGELADEFKIDYSTTAKSAFSNLLRQILKSSDLAKAEELVREGIVIKTVPLNPATMNAWEAMSFPKFSLADLKEEDWDGDASEEGDIYNESTFRALISQKFIFVPVLKIKVKNAESGKQEFEHWNEWKVGQSLVWTPDEYEFKTIMEEWRTAQQTIAKDELQVEQVNWGKGTRQENNLLKEKQTDFIHIRPHARDSKDIDIPFFKVSGIRISWQSFWLNKKFVSGLFQSE